jgi:hypothetical protein
LQASLFFSLFTCTEAPGFLFGGAPYATSVISKSHNRRSCVGMRMRLCRHKLIWLPPRTPPAARPQPHMGQGNPPAAAGRPEGPRWGPRIGPEVAVVALGMIWWSQQVPRPPMSVQYVQVGYIRAGYRRLGIIQASGWSWWLPTGVLAARAPTDFLNLFLNTLPGSNGHHSTTNEVPSPLTRL